MNEDEKDIVPIVRDRYLEKEIEKIKRWKEEGITKEEAYEKRDKRIIKMSDIEEIYAEDLKVTEDEKENTNNNEETENNLENISEVEEISELENVIDDVKPPEDINEIENGESLEKEKQEILEGNESEKSEEFKYLKDEELVDFPEQPFKLYNDEQKEDMINSIKINGIIQPLIVRPIEDGKYQILSGHNRRICGKEAGLEDFPCKIKYNLSDEEAKLYLVDTNLATRNEISPMERAKALLIRRNVYKTERIKLKIEKGILEDNLDDVNIRKKIQEVENMSNGNIQRYLRLNYLSENLKNLADNKSINLKVAENLSYLPKEQQKLVGNLIENNGIRISESQAKKLRQEENLNKERIEEFFTKKEKKNNEIITIKFLKEEIENYFESLDDVNIVKQKILEILRDKT